MNIRDRLPTLWGRDHPISVNFDSFRKEFDRLFDQFSDNFAVPAGLAIDSKFDLVPTMDVADGEKEITMSVELPGVEEKDIDISVTGNTITIKGEKKSETEAKDNGNHRMERIYGSFQRQLSLPFRIDADKVQAKSDKGVLTVTIAKPAEAIAEARKIAISGH